jgi:hypothetical protein
MGMYVPYGILKIQTHMVILLFMYPIAGIFRTVVLAFSKAYLFASKMVGKKMGHPWFSGLRGLIETHMNIEEDILI